MSYDASDEKQVGQRKKKFQRQQDQQDEDLSKIMETAEGRRFVQRLMDQTHMLAPNLFTGNSQTFYRIGKHDIGVWLYEEVMRVAPACFIEMMREKLEEDGV